jgi:ribosomal protein S27AE
VQDLGYVGIAVVFGMVGGFVGRSKGSSFLLWFLISAAVPVFGLLAAAFYRSEDRELRRQCPECGQIVMLHDALCMNCGSELFFPDRALASKAQMRESAADRVA